MEIHTSGPVSVMDDPLGCVTLAKHHCGLLQTYCFAVKEDLHRGVLKEVLSQFAGPARPISILYRHNPYMPTRVRVLIDFLVDAMQVELE